MPIDPLYLSWKMRGLDYETGFIDLADKINTSMPHHVVEKVQDALNEQGKATKGARVLVLGVAYKADVSDVRESPSLNIIDGLRRKGADVVYNDLHVPVLRLESGEQMGAVELSDEELDRADCMVVVTAHSAFDWKMIRERCGVVVDTRNVFANCN